MDQRATAVARGKAPEALFENFLPYLIARLAYLLKAFEHQTHHRGQCVIYLRLSGIKPPPEKLF